jgi:hypothetical protein
VVIIAGYDFNDENILPGGEDIHTVTPATKYGHLSTFLKEDGEIDQI